MMANPMSNTSSTAAFPPTIAIGSTALLANAAIRYQMHFSRQVWQPQKNMSRNVVRQWHASIRSLTFGISVAAAAVEPALVQNAVQLRLNLKKKHTMPSQFLFPSMHQRLSVLDLPAAQS